MALSVRTRSLSVPASVTTGPVVDVTDLEDLAWELGGVFVATIQLQGRMNSSADWQSIGAALTAGAVTAISVTLGQVRVSVTAYTSGTPVGYVGGHVS